jgi:hypothetical protein
MKYMVCGECRQTFEDISNSNFMSSTRSWASEPIRNSQRLQKFLPRQKWNSAEQFVAITALTYSIKLTIYTYTFTTTNLFILDTFYSVTWKYVKMTKTE